MVRLNIQFGKSDGSACDSPEIKTRGCPLSFGKIYISENVVERLLTVIFQVIFQVLDILCCLANGIGREHVFNMWYLRCEELEKRTSAYCFPRMKNLRYSPSQTRANMGKKMFSGRNLSEMKTPGR